ncbi:MAG: carboxylating nicotinate-nucleotide diphosphorylase [Lentisphaerae bacterium]|nr:carboxylating nicotinate-nucleotide diphosphorylase [Lentisphaerota bacterium]
MNLPKEYLQTICQQAIAEDVATGDATTLAIVPPNLHTSAEFVNRQQCVCAGMPLLEILFKELCSDLELDCLVEEGQLCEPGTVMAKVEGNARAILTGERTALNFLQRLCGIATLTRKYVLSLGESNCKVLDTRKTTPGMRLLEKYAVKMGGGQNHRIGLYDRIMIKDNHRELAKLLGPDSISLAVKACREKYPELEIEVEADNLDEVKAAAEAGVEYILLDNMSAQTMLEAIEIIAGRAKTEASGNITLQRMPSLSRLGLDFVSIGALTHSAPAIDIGLDIKK